MNRHPVHREQVLQRLPVQGTLPPGLRGTLFRNGPNPRYPAEDQHWFGGDGMVHAFTLGEDGVAYRNRWVRTARYRQEARAGRSLFHGLGASREALAEVSVDAPQGAANTSILQHAGRLVALEEGHAPAALDPVTLDTLAPGCWPVGDGPFTAHPKQDPQTGALWFFGARADDAFSRTIRVGALDAGGRLLMQERIEAPYPALVHDFAVTANHLAIPLFPLTADRERSLAGGPPLAWEAEHGCFLGVMRRDDPAATVRWLPVGTCFAFHVMNAWEDADMLFIDLMQSDAPPFFPGADAAGLTTLWRWEVDLAHDRVSRRRLSDQDGEFPQIDQRVAGRRHRHGYHVAAARGRGFDAICHRDEDHATETLFAAPEGDGLSEPIFVARNPDAAEGDGWLLAVQFRSATACSDLVVLDAQDIAKGPVARVSLPCRVPDGFHGSFVGARA